MVREKSDTNVAMDRLNTIITKAEVLFAEIDQDGVAVGVNLDTESKLWWKKEKGVWGLWVVRLPKLSRDGLVPAPYSVTRLIAASKHMRVAAAFKLEALFVALAEELVAVGDDIEAAITAAEAFVKEHEGSQSL
jgi:hypothetical protein